MTIKQKIKKISYKVAHPIRKIYWFLFRPHTRGAKCLIEYNQKFLLVRLNYAHRLWTIPGGGVNKKESFESAAIREAEEETGINVTNPVFIGSYKTIVEYKNDTVEVYHAVVEDAVFKVDPVEIKEARWFSRNELPDDRGPVVDRIFKFYDKHKPRHI